MANFTNEGGVDGRIRYLRNVLGLWLLQESVRAWEADGLAVDLDGLLRDAARLPAFGALVDPDDSAFLPPGDMPTRIAVAYRRTLREAQALSGHPVDVVHIVGGGVRNALLCQLTADACGLPVLTIDSGLEELRTLIARTYDVVRYQPAGDEAAWASAERRAFGGQSRSPGETNAT